MADKDLGDGPSLEMPSLGSLFKRKKKDKGPATDDTTPTAEDFDALVRGEKSDDASTVGTKVEASAEVETSDAEPASEPVPEAAPETSAAATTATTEPDDEPTVVVPPIDDPVEVEDTPAPVVVDDTEDTAVAEDTAIIEVPDQPDEISDGVEDTAVIPP
ncbi:MAG TPA: hypothetical protein VGE38_04190, partial [Nocardioides sp.]|uniref:hypothetical protein n=1 Tax=Nocardioides sp. TaxID=35761 RepID=UPI002EDB6133